MADGERPANVLERCKAAAAEERDAGEAIDDDDAAEAVAFREDDSTTTCRAPAEAWKTMRDSNCSTPWLVLSANVSCMCTGANAILEPPEESPPTNRAANECARERGVLAAESVSTSLLDER
jgi:hypothetical protein